MLYFSWCYFRLSTFSLLLLALPIPLKFSFGYCYLHLLLSLFAVIATTCYLILLSSLLVLSSLPIYAFCYLCFVFSSPIIIFPSPTVIILPYSYPPHPPSSPNTISHNVIFNYSYLCLNTSIPPPFPLLSPPPPHPHPCHASRACQVNRRPGRQRQGASVTFDLARACLAWISIAQQTRSSQGIREWHRMLVNYVIKEGIVDIVS